MGEGGRQAEEEDNGFISSIHIPHCAVSRIHAGNLLNAAFRMLLRQEMQKKEREKENGEKILQFFLSESKTG